MGVSCAVGDGEERMRVYVDGKREFSGEGETSAMVGGAADMRCGGEGLGANEGWQGG